jgi:hypothetical protein
MVTQNMAPFVLIIVYDKLSSFYQKVAYLLKRKPSPFHQKMTTFSNIKIRY